MANARQDEISTRACRCINIQIHVRPPQGTPPDFLKDSVADSTYTLTYVGRDGLSVAHPQMTMRTRKMGSLSGINRCVRYTTLTCLLCQTLAYRVQQLVPLDVEGQEGPLLPTYDWVEQDILMSPSGWIEVHSNCLDPDAVSRLMASTTYSPIFNVAVSLSTLAPSTQTSYVASTDVSHPEIPSQPILSNLRPLFPPAPFIPSHPVFSHLSSIATSKSQALRTSAEEQLSTLIRDRVAEIEKADEELKRVVEGLWRRFLENLGQMEKEWGASDTTKRRDSAKKPSINTSTQVIGAPVISVRDFVPVSSPVKVASPASSLPRVSSLSASLATSVFHHPRILQERSTSTERKGNIVRSPPPYSSHPSSVSSIDSRSLSSSASRSGEPLVPATGDSLIQPFKRSMDEARDTAASFRYFIDMEAEMEMMRGRHKLSAARVAPGTKEELRTTTEGANPNNTSSSAKALEPEEAKGDRLRKSGHDKNDNESRAKRKVTFDIKPDTLTTDGPAAIKVGNDLERDAQDMIFDLEGESSDRDSSDAAPILPFKEVPHVLRRHIRPRSVTSHGGLPASLSSLRPGSLPAYTSLQAQLTKDKSSYRTQFPLHVERNYRITGPHSPGPVDPQEEEILKLVAADTPSHRGAWKPNSKAWQLFVSRQGGKNGIPRALIPEEPEVGNAVSDTNESEDIDDATRYNPPGIPASLPISIEPLSRKLEPLSLGSYQPKTSLSDRPGTIVPCSPMVDDRRSTSALRKASYAARDRDRSMDPGTLDFVLQIDEADEDDESDDELLQTNPLDEGRSRRRALKILEARNRLPAAGMWRSLA